ncbi:cytochrome o ubiquinol oxidase subunit I [Saccharibacter floricola]|uniref:Cytochrome o ubiquinol oxidase subunit I n=1 Tax=Saccharibacter floricola DSM 15669 TaxID=1123227 RepID=A0ABQ0NYG5_9PROT|nr:cytochrome o ubiquinol oxidase subunit I [Saccharibacter floricola]GBQ06214.1 cytochrome o ubiquinol oxidase subunit I [Saccharibacter floricola DSM 15669]
MLGKLTLSAIPYDVPILVGTFIGVAVIGLAVLAAITYFRKWGYLWREWLTTVDHKKLGVMYIVLAIVMLLRGFADAVMMRTQLALSYQGNPGYLPPHHYDQVFSAHGTIMIFFMAMAFMTGLFNFVVPLQVGARDVAFPFLNSVSFYMTLVGAVLINISLFIGEFSNVGWLGYPPVSELQFNPGVGVDYYIWAVQISGIGTLLTGVNFFTTIVKMRAPGMKWMHLPVFTWTAFFTNIMILTTFPILTATISMLSLDRYLGMHFFTNDGGGNVMLYLNLIWAWGHPEVYILILPAFGVFSEIAATFSGKSLFGYKTMVYASGAITVLGSIVWVHHFFTMGAGADVNTFFGIMTMFIAVPTGVKIFNWLFTMYKGRVRFEGPMNWIVGFMITFSIGGMTGVMLAMPAADWVLHNSLFLVAHFHNVIIGGVFFGYIAGMNYWFPKVFGYKLRDSWGKWAFRFWFVGFYLSFIPLYIVGIEGMTRRLNHYDNPNWHPWLLVACVGVFVLTLGVICQVGQLVFAIVDAVNKKHDAQDLTGDNWGSGRTLEWSIPSPVPHYNFARLPVIRGLDTFETEKELGRPEPVSELQPIHMPKYSSLGPILGFFTFLLGFAMVWHIWWLAIVGLVGAFIAVVVRSADLDIDYYVPVEEIRADEEAFAKRLNAPQAAE